MSNEIEKIQRVKSTDSAMSQDLYENQLINEIRNADEELSKELSKEKINLVNIVAQMGKIQAMLARMTVETHGITINRNSDELEEIIVKLVGTYKSHRVTYMLYGASFAIQIFAAAAGFGFMGQAMKVGSASVSQVGATLQNFTKFFEDQQSGQRTLLQFIMEENKRYRSNSVDASQRGVQDLKEAIALSKKASEEEEAAINSAGRIAG